MLFTKAEITNTLDDLWYERFKALAFEDYEKLVGDGQYREQQKNDFLTGLINNPVLDYPELDSFNLEEREFLLSELLSDVSLNETNSVVRDLFIAKIEEAIAMVRMLKATKKGDDKAFSQQAKFIYGEPDKDDVKYVIQVVRNKALDKIKRGDEEQVQAAMRLLELLNVDYKIIDDASSVLPKLKPKGRIIETAEEAAALFTAELLRLGIKDWTVVIEHNIGTANFSVSQEYKTVQIPSTEVLRKRKISECKLRGLVAHEIGVHVLRRFNGAHSVLRLLGLGLDRYIRGDEGVATYFEQNVTGARMYAGIARYFSVLIAQGEADGIKRDFRETFKVLCDYRLLLKSKKEGRLSHVRSNAYNDCVRIFRGTTCATKGIVFPKDTAYFANRQIWQLVKNDPAVEATFLRGKFDPVNEFHLESLKKLGILQN